MAVVIYLHDDSGSSRLLNLANSPQLEFRYASTLGDSLGDQED